eukprot:237122-Hanusia_phi.AAC.3
MEKMWRCGDGGRAGQQLSDCSPRSTDHDFPRWPCSDIMWGPEKPTRGDRPARGVPVCKAAGPHHSSATSEFPTRIHCSSGTDEV